MVRRRNERIEDETRGGISKTHIGKNTKTIETIEGRNRRLICLPQKFNSHS